jgi:predicted nucleic acid-binding protein
LKRLYITDANIFIDLAVADLAHFWQHLELQIATTQLILDELEPIQLLDLHVLIQSSGLLVLDVQVEEIQELKLTSVLSLPDKSAICVALREQGIVLSGDGLVRKIASQHGLKAHGLLRLFDWIVEKKLISETEAANKLEYLVVKMGRRQP